MALFLLHHCHQLKMKDVGGVGGAERGIRLGKGTPMIVGPLRLLVVVLGAREQHLGIVEEGMDQRHVGLHARLRH